jgi:hypothetical protein
LRPQRLTTERIATQEQQLRRVMPHEAGVVAVLVPAGDAVHPLPHQIDLHVLHPAGIAGVRQCFSQRRGDAEVIIEQAQQQRAGVAAAARPIEARYQWLHERTTEQDVSGRAPITRQKASKYQKWCSAPHFYHTDGLLALAMTNSPTDAQSLV